MTSSPQKTGKKTEISALIFLGVITFTGFIAPFAHIFYDSSVPGVFGFPKMSSFLFAIGFPVLSITAGILFHFVSRKLRGILARAFTIIAFLFNYVGIFFLTWIFIPSIKDFDPVYYYLSIIGIALLLSVVLLLFSRYILGIVGKIDLLIRLIGNIRTRHFIPMASEAVNENNIDEIRKGVDKFDDEVFETLEELTK